MDKVIAVVYKGHTLGLLNTQDKTSIEVLNGLGSLGGISNINSPICSVSESDYRLATLIDFDVFHVVYNPAYNVIRETNDIDGFFLFDGITEVNQADRGCLEVLVQRENDKQTRYFDAEGTALMNIYLQASTNKRVICFNII